MGYLLNLGFWSYISRWRCRCRIGRSEEGDCFCKKDMDAWKLFVYMLYRRHEMVVIVIIVKKNLILQLALATRHGEVCKFEVNFFYFYSHVNDIWWCRFFLDFWSKSQLIMSDETRASSRIRTRLIVKNWKADLLLLNALFQSSSSFWFILFIILSTSNGWIPPKLSKDHFSPWSLSIFAH